MVLKSGVTSEPTFLRNLIRFLPGFFFKQKRPTFQKGRTKLLKDTLRRLCSIQIPEAGREKSSTFWLLHDLAHKACNHSNQVQSLRDVGLLKYEIDPLLTIYIVIMTNTTWLIFLVLFSSLSPTQAQPQWDITHEIESEIFKGPRKISVRLPERYFLRDSLSKFAVIYVLDGQYKPFWDMAKSNISYLTDSYNIIPSIAVGIHSEDRGAEFTPPSQQLKAHLEKEIFPLIMENYRVNGLSVLMGHSWAGQFIAGTLFGEKSDLFDGYIAISPSLGYQNEIAIQRADSVLSSGKSLRKFFYASTGDVGIREINFGGQVARLDSVIRRQSNAGLVWMSRTFNDRGHWSCVIPSVSEGLIQLSRNYWADIKVMEEFAHQSGEQLRLTIEAFNEKQENILGYHYDSDAHYLKFVAEDFAEQDLASAAEQLYRWSIELDPNVVQTHTGLAYLLRKQEKFKMAKDAYTNALQCLEINRKDYPDQAYEDLRNWLEDQIADL